jgi:hypothetical protein
MSVSGVLRNACRTSNPANPVVTRAAEDHARTGSICSGCHALQRKSNLPGRAFPTESVTEGARHQCAEQDRVARVPLAPPRCRSAMDEIQAALGNVWSVPTGRFRASLMELHQFVVSSLRGLCRRNVRIGL